MLLWIVILITLALTLYTLLRKNITVHDLTVNGKLTIKHPEMIVVYGPNGKSFQDIINMKLRQ